MYTLTDFHDTANVRGNQRLPKDILDKALEMAGLTWEDVGTSSTYISTKIEVEPLQENEATERLCQALHSLGHFKARLVKEGSRAPTPEVPETNVAARLREIVGAYIAVGEARISLMKLSHEAQQLLHRLVTPENALALEQMVVSYQGKFYLVNPRAEDPHVVTQVTIYGAEP